MSKRNDGGPAFPGGQFRTVQRVGEEPRDIPAGPQGMSLRDWFAGQANEDDIQAFFPSQIGRAHV